VLSCGFSDDATSHLSLGPAVLPQAKRWSEADLQAKPAPEG
jgi:hypothetical protein